MIWSIGLLFTLGLWLVGLSSAQHYVLQSGGHLSNIDIECNSKNIMVTVKTPDDFNGMIYPKGLPTNSSCLAQYKHAGNKISYTLPLRSCNTMSHDVKEGVEYFNTVVIQPHGQLVTKEGKGFHVRCRYQTKNKTTDSGISASGNTPTTDVAPPLPNCVMKIYMGQHNEHVVAQHVKIGDYLSLVISIDEQDTYGLKVTNCLVRDGLSLSEQPLINNDGCPIDEQIMGPFEYSKNLTSAYVTYPAHKFPYTPSVYYQCNVKLCLKKNGECDDVPPICDFEKGVNLRRRKRQSDVQVRHKRQDRSVEVYSGLTVNEADEEDDAENTASLSSRSDDEFCVSTSKFATGIAIAGVLLFLAILLLIACIVHRRRRKKNSSTAGSSIYSGPYSNRAYSRD